MPKQTVRIRALSNIMGLAYGDVVDVVPTPRVEMLIRGGHLEWVDESGAKVEYTEAVLEDASVDDEPPAEPKGSAPKASVAKSKASVKDDTDA